MQKLLVTKLVELEINIFTSAQSSYEWIPKVGEYPLNFLMSQLMQDIQKHAESVVCRKEQFLFKLF